ncbi:MAG: glutaminase A [Filifactoraceae bacterium]
MSLKDVIKMAREEATKGCLANYIPELAKGNPKAVGLCIKYLDGTEICEGDVDYSFTIQSVSKAVILMKVLEDNPIEKVREKISFFPTTESFNSIFQLETKNKNRPLNPFINAGAIAAISMLKGDSSKEKFDNFFEFFKKAAGNKDLKVNEKVFQSEKATGDRNRALAYFMKSTGVIEDNVEEILDIYFSICSIEVTCRDVANIGLCLANKGRLDDGTFLVSKSNAQIVKAVMAICGLYEESGDYIVNVGIPCKSGVGGGIMATVPNVCGIGVIGPALNEQGNSCAGMYILERLSTMNNWSIF